MFKRIKEEIINVIPAVVYFFVAFNLISLTFAAEGVRISTFIENTVAALLIGKILLVVDNVSFLNIFKNKPVVYNTIWKTLIYTFVSLLVRLGEVFFPLVSKYKGVIAACQHFNQDISWTRFWVIHIWILLLCLVFVTAKETVDTIGRGKVRKVFFGR
jgi:hypothetical protein